MMKEACKYLYENRADLFTFTGDLDGIWAKKRWVNVGGRLKMGAYINFSDTEFQRTPVAIRIVGLKEYVNNPYSPQIELSNKVQGQSFSSEIRKLQNQEVYFGEMNRQTQSLTKRSWRNALETIKQVEEAFPEYTQSIIPATVQTMMALVGNKAGQFAFVANKTNPITVPHTLYFDRNNKQINAGSGWIKHYTLGTTDIKPSHSAADYKYWYVSPFVSGRLDDKAKSYYLYIKANKAIETAEFVLSETKIGMEQEAGFYHFLYATVNSEYDGERGIAQLNGFTEITGGQMVTNRIASGNGQQFIALYDDRIEINAHLQISDSNKLEFKQLVNPDLQSLESRLKQYSNENNAKGEIYLRGTGLNKHAAPIIQINGQNIVPDNYRGLYLAVIRRSDLQVIFQQSYDTYGATEERKALADKLNTLNSDVLVTLVSRDAAFVDPYILGTDELKNALIRCGANDDNSKYVSRMPYAFLGIPNIGKGNGIEVYTSNTGNAPYAEIATKIINGTPQGMNSSFSGMLQTAKTATEAYARAQADLLKLQAIAEANRNAGLAITAEQQARIQEAERNLQAAKAHAEREVSKINIGGRNLVLSSKNKRILRGYTGIFYLLSEPVKPNELYVFSCMSERNGAIVAYFSNELGGERQYISGNIQWGKNVDLVTPNRAWRGITIFHEVHGIIPTPTSSIELVKLERGNKPTDWSPAPEDVENQIANINSDLETIRQNAARIEALENQNKTNTDQRIGKLDQKTAFLNDTQIAGNVVATGTMIVGNTLGTQAGITGVGNATNEVRLFAGSEFAGRYAAPFRVLQDGTVYATNAHISGQVNATSGQIGQFYINTEENEKRGRIYAGSRNTSEITIGNTGVEIESDSPLSKLSASFGDFNSMVLWNTYAAQKIDYTGSSSNRIGSYIKMRPQNNNLGESFAQFIDGNIFSIGKKSVFEDGYIGTAYTNTIVDNIKYTHTYIFTGVGSGYMYVNLPNSDRIKQIVGNNNITFELTIVMAHSVGGSKIVVQGVPSGHILDNDGGRAEGGNGYIEMARGDVMKLCFYGADYYISSLRR